LEANEQKAEAEQSDVKKLEQVLPEALDVVTKAEEMLGAVKTAAVPLSTNTGPISDAVDAALRETEALAVKKKIAEEEAEAEADELQDHVDELEHECEELKLRVSQLEEEAEKYSRMQVCRHLIAFHYDSCPLT